MREQQETATSLEAAESRLAWLFVLPALVTIVCVAAFPILWTFWESLHLHDLRMPWLGMPFVGWENYGEALADARAWSALGHTLAFTIMTVALELVFGLVLALGLDRKMRARGALRTAALLPWAVPTVVAALIWRFMFESPGGLADVALVRVGILTTPPTWFADPVAAWLPIVLADVWKTTPFVALLLLAGLQQIDPAVHEAAALDGAGPIRQLVDVTLPLLAPTLAVALVFRGLDAFRVFDVIYVLTGGGPGTATESISLYAFAVLFRDLRVGYGSALSMIVFAVSFVLALTWIRLLGAAREVKR
jgi:ABC-type sugar transport system permease subunit